MSRELGFFETYSNAGYDLLAGDGVVVTVARVRGPLAEAQVRRAAALLQHRHPLLQMSIAVQDGPKDVFTDQAYAAMSPEERTAALPLLVTPRRSDTDWQTIIPPASEEPIEQHGPYLWRLILVQGSDRHELILISRHEITDATSTTHMLRDLLLPENHDEAAVAGQPLPLLPSVEAMLPPMAPAATVAETPPTAPWRYEGFAPPKGRKPIFLFCRFDADEVARIKVASKDHGVTINSALSAAFFLAEYTHFHKQDPGTDVLYRTAISLRGRCVPPVGNEHLGTYAMTVTTILRDPYAVPFWTLAERIGHLLKSEIEQLDAEGFLPQSFAKTEVYAATEAGYADTSTRHCFSEGPWISNLGRLPFSEDLGPLKLEEMYFGTKQVAGDAGAVLSVITLNGRMFCSLTTAEPLMKTATAQSIFDTFVHLLQTHCP